MPKKKKKLFIEGVYGQGATPFNTVYDAQSDHGTFYGGLLVSDKVCRQLKEQPLNFFLSYKKVNNKYEVKYKIPEYGRSGDRNYNLRENINLITKWAYQQVLDKDGASNSKNSTAIRDIDFSYEKLIENGFPEPRDEKKREDFKAFCSANTEIIRDITLSIYGLAEKVAYYEALVEDLPNITTEPDRHIAGRVLQNNFRAYLNASERLNRIANIKPDEQECFIPWECGASRMANILFAQQANAFNAIMFADKQSKTHIDTIELAVHYDEKREGPSQVNVFAHHYGCGLKANINNQDVLISLESTAPRAGEMFFCPESSSQALGLYRNHEEMEKTFKDPVNSIVKFKDEKEKELYTKLAAGIYNKGKYVKRNIKIGHPSFKLEMYKLQQNKKAPLYGGLKDKLTKVDRFVWSSDKFSDMRDALLSLEKVDSADDYVVKMAVLSQKATEYLKYKLPDGNLAKEAKLSDLAKKRIQFAKDVFTFANVNLTKAVTLAESEVSRTKPEKQSETESLKI